MKEFHVTSTVNIEAESREDAIKKLEDGERNKEIAYDLLANAEVDEA